MARMVTSELQRSVGDQLAHAMHPSSNALASRGWLGKTRAVAPNLDSSPAWPTLNGGPDKQDIRWVLYRTSER